MTVVTVYVMHTGSHSCIVTVVTIYVYILADWTDICPKFWDRHAHRKSQLILQFNDIRKHHACAVDRQHSKKLHTGSIKHQIAGSKFITVWKFFVCWHAHRRSESIMHVLLTGSIQRSFGNTNKHQTAGSKFVCFLVQLEFAGSMLSQSRHSLYGMLGVGINW